MSVPTRGAYGRMMLIALAPQIVRCDPAQGGCGEPRGAGCKSRNGNPAVRPHAPRRAAVAHLSDDEAYAAMLDLEDELDARRIAAQAQNDAMRDDPQIRESQRRTREAWEATAKTLPPAPQPTFALRTVSERRKPLGPVRGADVVNLGAERMRRRSPAPSGGAA